MGKEGENLWTRDMPTTEEGMRAEIERLRKALTEWAYTFGIVERVMGAELLEEYEMQEDKPEDVVTHCPWCQLGVNVVDPNHLEQDEHCSNCFGRIQPRDGVWTLKFTAESHRGETETIFIKEGVCLNCAASIAKKGVAGHPKRDGLKVAWEGYVLGNAEKVVKLDG